MVTLILLPGLDGTGLMFADFVACLGPEVKVVMVSYPTDTPLTYDELEPIVRSFLPHNQPYYLLAESFSGPLAISIAASSPPGLLALILSCSFVCNPVPFLNPFRFAVGFAPVATIPLALLSFFVLGRFASPALRGLLAKSLALVAPPVIRARIFSALSVDVSALVSRLKIPILYLRASEDRIVRKSSSELVASLAPHTIIIELLAPHFLLQVVPSQAASSVGNFIGVRSGL